MFLGTKFDIYDRVDGRYVKTDCVLESIIEPFHALTDDEVRRYFKIDEDHLEWERAHRMSSKRRYVFDKCIIPENSRWRIEPTYSEEDY